MQIAHQSVSLYDLSEIAKKMLTLQIVHQAGSFYDLSEITNQKYYPSK